MPKYEKDLIELGRLEERKEILKRITEMVSEGQKKRDQAERGTLLRAEYNMFIDTLLAVGNFISKRDA